MSATESGIEHSYPRRDAKQGRAAGSQGFPSSLPVVTGTDGARASLSKILGRLKSAPDPGPKAAY